MCRCGLLRPSPVLAPAVCSPWGLPVDTCVSCEARKASPGLGGARRGKPRMHPRAPTARPSHAAPPTLLSPPCSSAFPARPAEQSHTDLRATPKAQLMSTLHGRAAGPRDNEPGIVEYTQDGGVLFTTAESSCPAVASLLQLEKAAGSYIAGLGPASAKPGAGGGRRRPFVARGGKGPRGQLAPRALVLIDTASGCRYKVGGRGLVGLVLRGMGNVVWPAGCCTSPAGCGWPGRSDLCLRSPGSLQSPPCFQMSEFSKTQRHACPGCPHPGRPLPRAPARARRWCQLRAPSSRCTRRANTLCWQLASWARSRGA